MRMMRVWARACLVVVCGLGACSKLDDGQLKSPPPVGGGVAARPSTATAGVAAVAGRAGGAGTSVVTGSVMVPGATSVGSAGTSAFDAGLPTAPAAADDADASTSGDGGPGASAADGGIRPLHELTPIAPPVADGCIDDVSAGDHTYTCDGLTYLVVVDQLCTQNACGVIFDIHGETMSGWQMRDSSQLAHLAPRRGYIVINPSATDLYTGASWDMTNDPPKLASFLDRAINAFHVDARRVHVGGFSQGAVMTWWFLCNHHDALASVAPIAGTADVACLDDGWKPRVPIFYWAGRTDGSVPIDSSRRTINAIVAQLTLTGGMQIAGDTAYARKHWEGAADMALDYVEHDYAGQILVDGHCVPGGFDTPTFGANNFGLNATTCVLGDIRIAYGELALQWYEDHPRPQP